MNQHSQFDYMWVTEEFKVLDLASNLPHNIQTPDLLPVQNLYRHLVLGQLMLAHCIDRWKKHVCEGLHLCRSLENIQ